jgi:dTDP-4-amino-4,6-dideoxygalactose transaminase
VSGPGLEEAVASVLEERTGRHCRFVPSGRLALYLALRTWLSPGDRIVMSPWTTTSSCSSCWPPGSAR